MKNYVSPGNAITHKYTADVAAGKMVDIGNIIGIAQSTGISGMTGELGVVGVYDLAAESGPILKGSQVYRVVASNTITSADTGGLLQPVGIVWKDKAVADLTANVKINFGGSKGTTGLSGDTGPLP